jgi:hypothetical protein
MSERRISTALATGAMAAWDRTVLGCAEPSPRPALRTPTCCPERIAVGRTAAEVSAGEVSAGEGGRLR